MAVHFEVKCQSAVTFLAEYAPETCSEHFNGLFFYYENRNLNSLCGLYLFQLPFSLWSLVDCQVF